jgi:hypothetical protein
MAVLLLGMPLRWSIWNTWSQAGVRSSSIVMSDPLTKNTAQLSLVQRDHKVPALAPHRAHQSFTKCVRGWRAHRRLEDHQTHRGKGPIHTLRINLVSIVNHESVRLVARDDHPKLLRGPLGRGVRRDVAVQDSSGADLHHHEDVEHPERGGNGHEKVAREDGFSMISDERAPRLRSRRPARWSRRQCVPRPTCNSQSSSSRSTRADPQESADVLLRVISERQNSRKLFRCQRMSVSGSTMVSKRRHSTIRDKATSVMRVASSARCGFTCRGVVRKYLVREF